MPKVVSWGCGAGAAAGQQGGRTAHRRGGAGAWRAADRGEGRGGRAWGRLYGATGTALWEFWVGGMCCADWDDGSDEEFAANEPLGAQGSWAAPNC